jgi:hypothetical protein
VRQKKDYGLRQPKAGRPLAGITNYGLRNEELENEAERPAYEGLTYCELARAEKQ